MSGSRDDTVRDGLKPWWRSVGFWVGLWGMAFLVWVWAGSFTRAWSGMRYVELTGPNFLTGYRELQVIVQSGMVIVHREVPSAEPWLVARKYPPGLSIEGSLYEIPEGESWGLREWNGGGVIDGGRVVVTLEFSDRWFPFWVVVAGYGVVWLGGLVMWRRWMRRRWERSRVVEG